MTMTDPTEMSKQALNEAVAEELFESPKPGKTLKQYEFSRVEIRDATGCWLGKGLGTGGHPPVCSWHAIDFHTGDGMIRVIEKMQELGWEYSVRSDNGWHSCMFERSTPVVKGQVALNTDLPNAVLIAALKAARANKSTD